MIKALLLLPAILLTQELYGQTVADSHTPAGFADLVTETYGLDQELLNGIQFVNRYKRCLGHPYFTEDRLEDGSLTIRGSVYGDLLLKYNLVTQDLELEYLNSQGMTNRIIVIADFVENFRYGRYQFLKLEMEDGEEKYYQVINTDQFTCFVHWFKNIVPVVNNINYAEECTDANRVFWLEREGEVDIFRNRREFIALFPDEYRKAIRKKFSRDMFRFSNTSPENLEHILREVSDLLSGGSAS